MLYFFYWLYRLIVRTEASQASNLGAIPSRVTNILKEQTALLLKKFVKTEVCFSSKKNN